LDPKFGVEKMFNGKPRQPILGAHSVCVRSSRPVFGKLGVLQWRTQKRRLVRDKALSETFDERDDYPEITRENIDRAMFRVGLKPATPQKQRITIELNSSLVAYFKNMAGEEGGICLKEQWIFPFR
jgi:hypothetical protein